MNSTTEIKQSSAAKESTKITTSSIVRAVQGSRTTSNPQRINKLSQPGSIAVKPRTTPRLFLYARKSTESEDRQIQSIDDQQRLAKTMVQTLGYQLVDVEGESRSARFAGKRPGFNRMLQALENGEADGIITWHPDRLARNAVDGGWILDLLDRGKIKYLHFASGYYFENTPEGKFMLGLIFSQAKYQIDKLSKDVLRGMTTKREFGHYPHRAGEGYVNNLAEKTIELDPERAPLLRRAFELILQETMKPSEVLKVLNEQWGYRTKKTKRSGGQPVSRTSFYDMLSNTFYYGICREKDLEYRGAHIPLLTQEEFDRIQVILGKPEKARQRRHEVAFTGLIRCGQCGCMVTATIAKGHTYYHCSNHKGICNRRGVREEALLAQIQELLDHIRIPESLEPHLRELVKRHFDEVYGHQHEVSDTQHKAIAEARRQIQNLVGMRLRELLSDEEYLKEKTRLSDELARLQREVTICTMEMERAVETVENVIAYAAWARETFDHGSGQDRHRLLEMLGSKFVLTGGKLLLELHPYLSVFLEDRPPEWVFKPAEIGSESTKETAEISAVSHGWASGTLFKLLGLIGERSHQEIDAFFPALPIKEISSAT